MIDEITFEVLRHRLDTINDDAAAVLARLSGSHLAAEARDLNTAIMAPDGRVVCCGRYVLAQVVSMHLVVRDILENYADNPGFGPGDQFVTNDPYIGTLHQPDVVVVAPIFVDGELVGWCGSTAHQADVGGPNPGGITYDARSIFDEAVPMPPVRIAEGGRLRRDLEREYLVRSRTAELNRLDLVGQVAANRSVTAEVGRLCGQYGADAVAAVMDRLLERTEALLRERLRALPDGRWRHVAYVEYRPHGGTTEAVYAVRLTMTKRGDDLELDFTGSDPQAPGTINAAYPALAGFAIGGVLIYLCGGLPWVPGGVWPVVRIRSREGTVVHARWPAGVAMSTAATCQAVRVSVNACLARMLEASRDLAHLVMASCQAAGGGGGTVHGERGDGTSYATMTLDEITGGGGATWSGDGADSSGYTTSPGASCANVEVNEAYLPLLYERRAELADTGGPGRHRGGVGTLHALTPHGDGASMTMMSFGQGLQHPLAAGGVRGGASTAVRASWPSCPISRDWRTRGSGGCPCRRRPCRSGRASCWSPSPRAAAGWATRWTATRPPCWTTSWTAWCRYAARCATTASSSPATLGGRTGCASTIPPRPGAATTAGTPGSADRPRPLPPPARAVPSRPSSTSSHRPATRRTGRASWRAGGAAPCCAARPGTCTSTSSCPTRPRPSAARSAPCTRALTVSSCGASTARPAPSRSTSRSAARATRSWRPSRCSELAEQGRPDQAGSVTARPRRPDLTARSAALNRPRVAVSRCVVFRDRWRSAQNAGFA
ncbi:hydantoinase B/oxoprolinase family protein [Nonomuraea ferruginea]